MNGVTIKRSLKSYGDSCVIKLPSLAKIKNGTQVSGWQTVGRLINDGDVVSVKLGYDGVMVEEYGGFVRRRTLGMPLEVECENYSRQLRLNVAVSGFLGSTNVRELIEIACGIRGVSGGSAVKLAKAKTDVTVMCEVEVPVVNVRFLPGSNGLQIIDEVNKLTQRVLSIFFITPKVLWVGLTYTPYTKSIDPLGVGNVTYRLGYNCIKDNGLKERVVSEPVQVILNGVVATGQVVQSKSEADYAARKEIALQNNITDVGALRILANEKQYRMNYAGYEGVVNGFLQPYCAPGYQATIIDDRYPERNGVYLVEGVTVTFGVMGARRAVELGPKVGFNADKI